MTKTHAHDQEGKRPNQAEAKVDGELVHKGGDGIHQIKKKK